MAIKNIAVVSGLVFACGILSSTLVDARTYGPIQHGENLRYEGMHCDLRDISLIHEYMCIDVAIKIQYFVDHLDITIILFSTNIIGPLIRFHTISKLIF